MMVCQLIQLRMRTYCSKQALYVSIFHIHFDADHVLALFWCGVMFVFLVELLTKEVEVQEAMGKTQGGDGDFTFRAVIVAVRGFAFICVLCLRVTLFIAVTADTCNSFAAGIVSAGWFVLN
ncbi:hypothetical protein BvCmsKSP035_00001 [Escherichia coli]|nr:hypothetical protein BvCmsKSP035_00001 [Escherichia coli]